jgi:hypothetical protein
LAMHLVGWWWCCWLWHQVNETANAQNIFSLMLCASICLHSVHLVPIWQ